MANESIYGEDPQGAAEKIASEGLANKVELDIHGKEDSRVETDTEASEPDGHTGEKE